MRWSDVMKAVAAEAAANATIISVYGTTIRKSSPAQDFIVPSLEYMLASSAVNELWEPHLIQFSQWTKTMDDLALSDAALHRLFDHELQVIIQGIPMWAYYVDGGELTGPAREGYYGLASRFQFTPVRSRLLPGRGS